VVVIRPVLCYDVSIRKQPALADERVAKMNYLTNDIYRVSGLRFVSLLFALCWAVLILAALLTGGSSVIVTVLSAVSVLLAFVMVGLVLRDLARPPRLYKRNR
jgi:hypothetical protein